MRVEAWAIGSVLYGVPLAAALIMAADWLGLPRWIGAVPIVPAVLIGATAIAQLAMIPTRTRFAGFVVMVALALIVLGSWQAALSWAAALVALRLWGEAAAVLGDRLGLGLLR